MKIIKGAHNALTYAKPRSFWGYFTLPFARCQNKDIERMAEAGISCFDIRVFWDYKRKRWVAAHGLLTLGIDIEEVIREIQKMYFHAVIEGDPIVRIILERDGAEWRFKDLCEYFENRYPGINFIGGNRKSDWKQIYYFNNPYSVMPIIQQVSSMYPNARGLYRIIPKWFAKKYTRGVSWTVTDDTLHDKDCIILRDFV